MQREDGKWEASDGKKGVDGKNCGKKRCVGKGWKEGER